MLPPPRRSSALLHIAPLLHALLLICSAGPFSSRLTADYYAKSCPRFLQIICRPTRPASRARRRHQPLPPQRRLRPRVRAKIAVKLACPGTVSCSDILVVAARDLVTMLGGPYYDVVLGRRDTEISRVSLVAGLLPRPKMIVSELLSLFASRGFSAQEMVALAGTHTVGFSHCKEFSSGIYGFSKSSSFDPSYR